MNLRLVTVSFDSKIGSFPAEPLSEINGEVVSVVEHFFHHENVPHLLLVVHYRPSIHPVAAPTPASAPQKTRGEEDPRKGLNAESKARYEALRTWRAGRAQADGVPVYLIFSNRQLAEIARRRPETLKALQQIKGIGDAKTKRYGAAVLEILHPSPAQTAPVEDADAG